MNASLSLPPASVRRSAYAALFVSLVHIIFGAVVACVIAQLFILRAVFRTLPILPSSSQVPTPHRVTEILWVVLPVGLLIAVFIGAYRALPL